jgi:hypothetical protein
VPFGGNAARSLRIRRRGARLDGNSRISLAETVEDCRENARNQWVVCSDPDLAHRPDRPGNMRSVSWNELCSTIGFPSQSRRSHVEAVGWCCGFVVGRQAIIDQQQGMADRNIARLHDPISAQSGLLRADHFVSSDEQLVWHGEPKRLRRFEIYDKIENSRSSVIIGKLFAGANS